MMITSDYVPPPPYEPPAKLDVPVTVRMWTWVWVSDVDHPSFFSRYSTGYTFRFEHEVRDIRTGEVVGEFIKTDVEDDKLYATCTLTRAYKSVSMHVAKRDERGYETGDYKLVASHIAQEECPLLTHV